MLTRTLLYATTTTMLLMQMSICGCAGPKGSAVDADVQPRRADIHERTDVAFASAVFFKPSDMTSGRMVAELAPLIVQETASDGSDSARDRFGAVRVGPDSSIEIDTATPTIYTKTSMVFLSGRRYDQVVYLWYYPSQGVNETDDSLNAQGVRITLNAEGQPCIWEVLADETDTRTIYVSRSLEDAASAQFGQPLAGRRFVAERAVGDQPHVVVERVLDDGPVPMGPFVYLYAGTRSVATMLCRCMPSQVDEFIDADYYELLPIDNLAGIGVDRLELMSRLLPAPLDKYLRLPDDF